MVCQDDFIISENPQCGCQACLRAFYDGSNLYCSFSSSLWYWKQVLITGATELKMPASSLLRRNAIDRDSSAAEYRNREQGPNTRFCSLRSATAIEDNTELSTSSIIKEEQSQDIEHCK
ncbi:unnamed protein product [Clavelina lepadiformis]|uniref:Uncharacterized protein n=1 Tax=Clavelina lepadiformis TaxID=159417 RepID=A0ABP0F3Z3_CLALP